MDKQVDKNKQQAPASDKTDKNKYGTHENQSSKRPDDGNKGGQPKKDQSAGTTPR